MAMKIRVSFIATLLGSLIIFGGLALTALGVDLNLESGGSIAGWNTNRWIPSGLVFIGAILQWIGVTKL